jgi:hypothetical protein
LLAVGQGRFIVAGCIATLFCGIGVVAHLWLGVSHRSTSVSHAYDGIVVWKSRVFVFTVGPGNVRMSLRFAGIGGTSWLHNADAGFEGLFLWSSS